MKHGKGKHGGRVFHVLRRKLRKKEEIYEYKKRRMVEKLEELEVRELEGLKNWSTLGGRFLQELVITFLEKEILHIKRVLLSFSIFF